MPDSRRALYRVLYPVTERPILEADRFLHEVVDISEKGVRFVLHHRRPPELGTPMAGTIQFRRGEEVAVRGAVIRSHDGVVVLGLNPPLPFSEILAEQRYLRSKGYTLTEQGEPR